jgi:[ribosomal protein S5]-alanine N-acetyltransferase
METNNYGLLNKINHLETERLVLRLFEDSDIEDIYEYASDEEVVKYLTWSVHKNIDYTRECFPEFFLNKPGVFAIELREEKKCVGCIDLRIEEKNDKASF